MSQTASAQIDLAKIHALLAAKGYAVTETSSSGLRVKEVDSGLALHAELQGQILFFTLACATVPSARLTPALLRKMLDADNGVSTSHFQINNGAGGEVTITLNNFCKLEELGADDEDDILSCVSFILADVMHARNLLAADLQ